jgi:hypothetical protein
MHSWDASYIRKGGSIEILYSIFTEFDIAMTLVRLIKVCLNEISSKVHTRENNVCLSFINLSCSCNADYL